MSDIKNGKQQLRQASQLKDYQCVKHNQICIGADLNPNTQIDEILVCANCLQDDHQHRIQFVTLQEVQKKIDQHNSNLQTQKLYQIEFKRSTLVKLQDLIGDYLNLTKSLLNKFLHICSDLIMNLDQQKISDPSKKMSFVEEIQKLSKQDQDPQDQDNIFNFYTQFMNLADLMQLHDYQKNYIDSVENILIDLSAKPKNNVNQKGSLQKIELKCLHHNDQYQMLDLNAKTNQKNRLLCLDCPPSNPTSLNKSLIQWQALKEKKLIQLDEYRKELNENRFKVNFQLRQFRNSAVEISNSISQFLNDSYFKALWEIIQMAENLEKSLQLINHKELQDIAEILSSQENKQFFLQNWINQHKESFVKQFQQKISLQLNTLFQNLQSCYKTLKHYILKDYQDISLKNNIESNLYQDQFPSSKIQGSVKKPFWEYQMICKNQEKNKVFSMAFNQKYNIFVASFGERIKVYDYREAQFQYRQTLQLENQKIIQLFYSQEAEIFYSGSQEGSIVQWSLNQENQFIQSNLISSDKIQGIKCLISFNANKQMIVASDTLTIWRVINQENKWELDYSLNKHQQGIINISLNESKTQFLSSGFDNKIILWQKGEENIFKCQQIIETQQNYQVCFIADHSFACQSIKEDNILFYEIDVDQQLFVLKDQKLLLRAKTQKLYHQEIKFSAAQDLLACINGNFITIFQQGEGNTFRINQVIEFKQSQIVLFALTIDGKYLVTWDDASMTFFSRAIVVNVNQN